MSLRALYEASGVHIALQSERKKKKKKTKDQRLTFEETLGVEKCTF